MLEVTVQHIATQNRLRSSTLISPLHTLQRNPERLYRSAVFQFIAANTRPYPNRQNLSTAPNRPSLLPLPVLHQPKQKPRHFDRSCSQSHREQRSGEICFSTHTFTQPRPRRRTCCCSCRCPFSTNPTKSPVICPKAPHSPTLSNEEDQPPPHSLR